ncbi:MAG: T9SS type A sorting domain-containing protein [Bacteroidetes bacterium]|nr:T9SS type A sorting domain-containing protein [Bacteroidota bacterium]
MKKLLLSISALVFGCVQLNAQAPNLSFSNIYKGASTTTDFGTSVVALPNAEVALAGSSGNINPNPFKIQTSTSTFVGKYNEAGVNIWYSPLGGNTSVAQVATDAAGNIYIVGSSQGTIAYFGSTGISSVGTNTLGSQNIAVAKYSNAGVLQWAKVVGSSGFEYGTGIAVDANGDVYVTGYNDGTGAGIVDFEPGNASASFSIYGNSFLLKLTTNGNYIWHRIIPVGGYNYHSVCVDNNNVYLASQAAGSNLNINPAGPTYTVTTNGGSFDILLAKFRLNGTLVNAKVIGSNGNNDYSRGIEVKGNRLALFGSISGTAINMNGYLATPNVSVSTNGASKDGFIAVYDTNLVCQWAKPVGTSGTLDETWGGTFDNSGNVLVSGQYMGTVAQPCNFNIGSVGTFTAASNSTSTTDYFYAAYNVLTGTCSWLYHDGISTANDNAADISLDVDGRIWATGLFSSSVSGSDMFLNKHFCTSTYTVSMKQDGISLSQLSQPNRFDANGCNAQNPVFTAIATPSTNVKYTFYNLNGAAVAGNSMTAITTNPTYAYYGGKLLVKDTVTKCEQVFDFVYGNIGTSSLTVNASTNTACSGSSVTLTGNFYGPSTTYTWMPGNIVTGPNMYQQVFTPTTSTTYTAIVNDTYCLWKASATVNVNPLPVVVANSTSTLVCTGPTNTFTLSASGTATTFTWSSVNYGLIGYNASYTQGPVATNTFVVTGSNGTCTAQSSVVVVVSPCTGIDEQSNSSEISIYPNPNSGILFIDLVSLSNHTTIELTDVTGRIILSHPVQSLHEQLNMTDLHSGVYFLTLKTGERSVIQKIIRQ